MTVTIVWVVCSCMVFQSECPSPVGGPVLTTYSMKLDKAIVQRRLDLMAAEGVVRPVAAFGS
jgi:hypothetical protein